MRYGYAYDSDSDWSGENEMVVLELVIAVVTGGGVQENLVEGTNRHQLNEKRRKEERQRDECESTMDSENVTSTVWKTHERSSNGRSPPTAGRR